MCDSCWEQFRNSFWTIVLILIIIWSYYTYVVELCIMIVAPYWKMVLYLSIYHVLFITFIIVYFTVMCYKQWYIPRHYFLNKDYLQRLDRAETKREQYTVLMEFCVRRNIRVYMRTNDGRIRYCDECRIVKPDRTHHCSTCDTCILKMDHHCPWVNNCIGFFNYKYFVVFLLYATIYCFYVAGTGMEYCIYYIMDPPKHAYREINIICCIIAATVIGHLTFVLLILHLQMIGDNETTIESMYPPTFSAESPVNFSKGCAQNYDDQCGSNCCLWCLPINTFRGNGYEFDVLNRC